MSDGQGSLHPKPFQGLKVLEMGQLLAGPFAGEILAWFGAEVIKVEPPEGGDAIRTWREMYQGTSLWWRSLARNKKSVTINLRNSSGQELVRQLAARMDVLIENFTPGTMEKWGLGYEELSRLNPRLIMARISGWGQSGPYAHKPGFASVAEAVGGLRYITGYPDRPPTRANVSMGDSLTGLHAAIGILTALYARDVLRTGRGQVVDVAIYESVFNMLESVVPEYSKLGIIRERAGTSVTGIVPTGTYPTSDGKFVVIGANSDSIFKRLAVAIERPDMAQDPRFETNEDRVQAQKEIEDAIGNWISRHTAQQVKDALDGAKVPAGLIYSVADMMRDPHFIARGLFEPATLPDGTKFALPAVTPKLTDTPGATEWIGPALGEHNREILGDYLGLSEQRMQQLAEDGTILPLGRDAARQELE